MIEFASKHELSKALGISEGTIDGWMDRHLYRGFHYTVVGHTTLFYKPAVNEWLKAHLLASRPAPEALESGCGKAAPLSTVRPSTATPRISATRPVDALTSKVA